MAARSIATVRKLPSFAPLLVCTDNIPLLLFPFSPCIFTHPPCTKVCNRIEFLFFLYMSVCVCVCGEEEDQLIGTLRNDKETKEGSERKRKKQKRRPVQQKISQARNSSPHIDLFDQDQESGQHERSQPCQSGDIAHHSSSLLSNGHSPFACPLFVPTLSFFLSPPSFPSFIHSLFLHSFIPSLLPSRIPSH